MSRRSFQIEDAVEALVVEQALAMVRDLKRTCASSPHGSVLIHAERVALDRGRELMRQTLEAVINEQGPGLEKKGPADESVPPAKVPANTRATPPGA